jgi:hypothetical protein
MKVRSILNKLKSKKIDVYVRDLGQYGHFQGTLKNVTEDMILLKSRYNRLSYIPLSEIVIVTEHEVKTKLFNQKLEEIEAIH